MRLLESMITICTIGGVVASLITGAYIMQQLDFAPYVKIQNALPRL